MRRHLIFFPCSFLRYFTMATYKKTDDGKLKLSLNRVLQKKKRRSEKIAKLKTKIDELESFPTLPQSQKLELERFHFEVQQAQTDLDHLDLELETIRAARRSRKGTDKEDYNNNESDIELAKEEDQELNADDEFLKSLGMQPENVDEQEITFQNM